MDGHRSPGLVISPYAVQTGLVDHTFYTQLNMTRTIEQILGIQPMTVFDLVASPMTTVFTDTPNTAPWTHLTNTTPLDTLGPNPSNGNSLAEQWNRASNAMFAGKMNKPDSVDAEVLSHVDWYVSTGFSRPYPGETRVHAPSDFKARLLKSAVSDNDD